MICISGHGIQPAIIFNVNIGQNNNIGQISKIVNFNPIDLKFEEELHIRSLSSTTNYLRSNLFYGFCKFRALHDVFLLLAKSKILQVYWSVDFAILYVCLSVCLSLCHLHVTISNRSSQNFTTWKSLS